MNPITKLKSKQVNPTKVIRRPWETEEEDLLVSLILRDIDYATISNRLDRTISAVANRAIRLGYSKAALKASTYALGNQKGTRKKSKPRKKNIVKVDNVTPLLKSKIKNYRILVGALAIAEAATLTMLVM
jgi:hypothetical protein